MADETIVVKKEEIPPPPTIAESQLNMAVEFGRMTKANEQLLVEIMETKAQQNQIVELIRNQNETIQLIRSQQDITTHQTEELKESQKDITSILQEDSEKEEEQVLTVTPNTETTVTVEQKPINSERTWFQKLCYGRNR
jgi:hypothetical protein